MIARSIAAGLVWGFAALAILYLLGSLIDHPAHITRLEMKLIWLGSGSVAGVAGVSEYLFIRKNRRK